MICFVNKNGFRLSCKQNRYPVLLLTQGRNSKYDDYRDPRTWTIKNGIWFAKMGGLLGKLEKHLFSD